MKSDLIKDFRAHPVKTFLVLFVVVIIFTSIFSDDDKPATSSEVVSVQKQAPYEIVDRWTIPNGGEGKVIVISPEHLNDADMTALGERLKQDTRSDRNANISIFDDKRAALLRDSVLGNKASTSDQDFYDKHFIGQYSRNGNSGYHQLDIYFDGVMGSNRKTITY
jgi:hypothetical protein